MTLAQVVEVNDVPEWLVAPVVASVIAALGYVAKLLMQEWTRWRTARADEATRLLVLDSLLNASGTAFTIQRRQAGRLAQVLRSRQGNDGSAPAGLERLFSAHYDVFLPEEAELHALIRGYTEHALHPINTELQKWLDADLEFRVRGKKTGTEARLADELNKLDAHLLLWQAKYAAWIPNQPRHALVYLADEEDHGIRFPKGLEPTLSKVLIERKLKRAESGTDSGDGSAQVRTT